MNPILFLALVLALAISPTLLFKTIGSAGRSAAHIWNIANWYTRLSLRLVIAWPLVLLVVALAGDRFLTSCLALMPLAAILLLGATFRDPLAVAAPEFARAIGWLKPADDLARVRRLINTVVMAELLWGVYLTLVPVWKDKELLPFFFLVVGTLAFASVSFQGRLVVAAKGVLALFIVAITAIFLLGGRTGAENKATVLLKTVESWVEPKPKPPTVVTPVENRDFMEDGERIKLVFPPGRDFAEVTVPIPTDKWSKWIDASSGARAWIESVELAGYTIACNDGTRFEVGPNDEPDFGSHVPIIKAKGTVLGQKLKVTAFRR